jgi:hypothetical protein
MLTSQQTPLPAFPDELELTALQKPFHSAWKIPAQSYQCSAQVCNAAMELIYLLHWETTLPVAASCNESYWSISVTGFVPQSKIIVMHEKTSKH